MAQNLLITGGAGFIGGSLITDLLSRSEDPFKSTKVFATVRSDEQAQALSKLDVGLMQFDLTDKQSVEKAVLDHQINIVVHTAGAFDPIMTSSLISALGKRRKESGCQTFFIHTSVMTMFSEEGGWPYGEVKDTDSVLEKEKTIPAGNPVRDNNILIAEEAKAHDVVLLNVAVPMTYGRGTGPWRKLSVNIPALVRASIKLKTVHKFEHDGNTPTLHISDLVSLYVLLLERILRGEPLPTGQSGYYFAMNHRAPWWKVMDGLAKALYKRGLVNEPTVTTWPSYEEAADTLGFPRRFIRGIGASSGDIVPVNAFKVGWQPKWDEKRFLDSLDDEVQAVLELDTVKSTLFDSLMPTST